MKIWRIRYENASRKGVRILPSTCVESPIIRPLLHTSRISQDGKSALILASENEHAEIVKYLVDANS